MNDETSYALCAGCGQSALKAFAPEDAPKGAAHYVCYHCAEETSMREVNR